MKNTGLIIEQEIRDYVFLSSDSKIDNKIIREDGDWTKYLPTYEKQRLADLETYNCVGFSACNVIETYFTYLISEKKISNINYEWLVTNGYIENGRINFSDRFVGQKAGTKIGVGNTGSRVANAIHNNGLIPERLWPFEYGMDAEEYYSKIPTNLTILGLEFAERFIINFESFWVKDIKEALKYSPVQVYVNAWYSKNGKYYNPNNHFNHAVERYKSNTKQILDHYDPFLKTLITDYNYFPSGYKYTVKEIINPMNVEEFLRDNDLLFVRNSKTGQFGRIMQEKLKVVETKDRGTLLLLDDAVRKNGRTLSEDEWSQLPIEKF